ncbi:MAG: ABC transporter ATP-binding protein [Syntrophomonadaceae bacterium]|jgi:branched-chain amino acid transport system ATP-binding protein
MLSLHNVHTYYDESHILQGVSLKVASGSIVALLGRNGMGKTTTINSIMGMQTPRSGDIFFKGINIAGLPPYKINRMGMSIVPQGRRIFPSLTVKENLLLGVSGKSPKKNSRFDLDTIYSWFPILRVRANQPSQILSGGEQEMLCIGRALISDPDLILMDEPFEGLAPIIIKELVQKLQELNSMGLSILLVEQNLALALSIADYVYVMNKGMIVLEGAPDNLGGWESIHKIILGF